MTDLLRPEHLMQASDETRTNPWAFCTAAAVNSALVALLILLGLRGPVFVHPVPKPAYSSDLSRIDIFTPLAALSPSPAGGSSSNDLTDPATGRPPKFERTPMAAPVTPVLENPQLPIDSAVATPLQIKLEDDTNLPKIGMRSAAIVTLDSSGRDGGNSIGTGRKGLYGSGDGLTIGPGSSTGIYAPGGDVSAPVPVVAPEAEFSDEARRQKFQGVCLISVIVDAKGNPQNPRVIRPLGMGLDEKAIEAVLRYRFKPARKAGQPVAVRIVVEVNFRLY